MAETKEKKSNKALLEELGVDLTPTKKVAHSPKEERIIAGFEEIQRFVEEHGHQPQHGEDRDIFERLFAVRLDRIRVQAECLALVETMDHQGLLTGGSQVNEPSTEYKSDKALLAELGIEAPQEGDITHLKHVRSQSEKARAKAEEIGQRVPCKDFERFRPLFETVQEDIKTGLRKTIVFSKDGSVEKGNFFILSGQKAYIADVGEEFIGTDGRKEYRLRVIFDNGVESNQLMRSIQKRLWEDETGRRITDISMGPLFDDVVGEQDAESGTIYILRSMSELPMIAENRKVIHKIGVTGGSVKTRISNAKLDPTYLMADVEIVATYELFNINRFKLENIIRRFFEPAKLDIKINDRFGNPVTPREWFFVPLFIIDAVVDKIKVGDISEYRYDPKEVKLVKMVHK